MGLGFCEASLQPERPHGRSAHRIVAELLPDVWQWRQPLLIAVGHLDRPAWTGGLGIIFANRVPITLPTLNAAPPGAPTGSLKPLAKKIPPAQGPAIDVTLYR